MKPKEVIVLSGKGGTGKTSITAALSQCFTTKVLVDCDVDAADLHLLLKTKSYQVKPFLSGHMAQINPSKCNDCGACYDLCRFESIKINEKGHYQIIESNCEGCKVCVDHCPQKAIDWIEAQNGVWKVSKTNQGDLFHARLNPGAENSGKLVTHVRQKALENATLENIPLILVDGPPGIGCPVIASVTGGDLVLAITEPTPSGYHDLERVLKLVKHFQIKSLIVINKADLSEEYSNKINDMATHYNSEVIAMIPYSSRFTQAQLQGISIIESHHESHESREIQRIAQIIRERIGLEV